MVGLGTSTLFLSSPRPHDRIGEPILQHAQAGRVTEQYYNIAIEAEKNFSCVKGVMTTVTSSAREGMEPLTGHEPWRL